MASLFGGEQAVEVKKPSIPNVPEWPGIVLLEKEKSLIGIYLSAHPLDDYKLEIESYCSKDINFSNLNSSIDKLRNRDLTFAGLVTDVHEAISKNGKPYSNLTLTDYSDSYKTFFFGNDYVNFGKYCKKGLFLLVKGKVSPRWRDSDQLEFKINKIELLSELRSKMGSINIELQSAKITNEFIEIFYNKLEGNKGNTLLKFNIFDSDNQLHANMFSRKWKIELTDDMVDFFQKNPDIAFTIN
jgi:DNA polymerase-3 subunit alpha